MVGGRSSILADNLKYKKKGSGKGTATQTHKGLTYQRTKEDTSQDELKYDKYFNYFGVFKYVKQMNTDDSLIQSEEQQVQEKSLDDLLTTEQVAKQYPIYSSNSLRFYRSINRSTFPYIKIGRTVRYKRSDIEDTLNSKRVSNA